MNKIDYFLPLTTKPTTPTGRVIKVLELYSGTGSIRKEAKALGMDVFSVDIIPAPHIDYSVDILNFDYSKVSFVPDVIWASPPCDQFSICSVWKYWESQKKSGGKVPKDPYMTGVQLLSKTLEIIAHYDPEFWFIENPRGMMRKMEQLRLPVDFGAAKRHTVTYCQYGAPYMKPTDIWTNSSSWVPRKMCKPGAKCHASSPSGTNKGLAKIAKSASARSVIPPALCREVLMSCMSPAPAVIALPMAA